MWKFHDQEIQNLKKQYDKVSKQTQLRLQEIFDSIDFDFEKLYNIADSKTKRKINTYIEGWKGKELLEGYFGMLAKNIYSKTRVKNSEILELLIYSAYIEEQKQLDETEQNTFKKVINYYYQEGQKEVDVTKKSSIIPEIVLATILSMPNAKGYIWKDYKEGITKYNAEQIYRQATIDLQQQKNLDITNDIYQNIIKRQSNSKLNINGNKISGDVDLTLIGMNNKAKIEGIYSFAEDAEVEFIAVEDEVTTKMCHSLNGQRFKVYDWNEFKRYSKANDSIVNYKCYGLVTGLNLPPIDDGFHWCRSTIKYVKTVEKGIKTEYNELELPKMKKEVKSLFGDEKLNKDVKKLFNKYLTDENVVIDENNPKPMYYSVDKDKIVINPKHKDFDRYNKKEALSHEIIHLIEKRNKLTDRIDIEKNLSKAQNEISLESEKYTKMFEDNRYADNMTLSDIFSSLTYDNIAGNVGHDFDYWYDIDNIKSELSANIMSAYLNNNTDTLNIIDSIKSLKNIKKEVIKKYDKYTR